jgi:hypothetical protein
MAIMKTMVRSILKKEKSRLNKKSGVYLNVLNSGMLVDLKKIESNVIEMIEKRIK